MGHTRLDEIAEQGRRAQERRLPRTSLLVDPAGVTSDRRGDGNAGVGSERAGEVFAARGCSTCGYSTTCRNCDGKGYFSAPWAISCRHCGGSGRCPNR